MAQGIRMQVLPKLRSDYMPKHTYQRDPDSRRNGVLDWACVVCGKDEPSGNHH